MTNERNPWELIADKTISQLVFAYEMVLTEMRTHAKANRTIREWVERIDSERDEFVLSMLVKPDEPTCSACDGTGTLKIMVAGNDGNTLMAGSTCPRCIAAGRLRVLPVPSGGQPEPSVKSRPTCKGCGTHEVSLEQTCHNSACTKYAKEITVYEGWRDPPPENRQPEPTPVPELITCGICRRLVTAACGDSNTAAKGCPNYALYRAGLAAREHPTTNPATAYTCGHPPEARGLTGCLLCGASF